MPLPMYRSPSNYNVEPIYEKYVGLCFNCFKISSIGREKIFNFSYSLDKSCFICNDNLNYVSIPFNFGRELKMDLIDGN